MDNKSDKSQLGFNIKLDIVDSSRLNTNLSSKEKYLS